MNNKLTKYAASMLLAMGMMSAPAQAIDLEISNDIGIYSQYVWRGAPQGNGEASVQGDIGASIVGVSASLWYATLGQGNSMEYDLTLDYSGEIVGISYSVGVLRYGFLHGGSANPAALEPAVEFYVGAGFGPASITTYYDKDSKDIWIDLGGELEALGYNLSAGISYAIPDVGTSEVPGAAFGLSKEFELADGITASPSLTYNLGLGNTKISKGGKGDQVVAGINFAY